jgi:putative ABC transport system permease protein
MKYARLVWMNLMRRKGRTALTVLSVMVAMFLFAGLRSVLTTLDASEQIGSESRLVVTNNIGITFLLPDAYANRIAAVDGVKDVTWANWFGAQYIDARNFFAQFAVDADSYFRIYPEFQIPPDQYKAFMQERTGAIVGRGLMERFGWHLGQTVTLKGTIFPGDWDFVIRGVYVPTDPSYGDQNFYFHYAYLYEGTNHQISPGWYMVQLADPSRAPEVSQAIDATFKNSSAPTKTETERAMQAGFVTMWGNVAFLVRAVGTAVFFAILMVAANTMMMAARERVNEVAILKTLGFGEGLLAGLVLVEALVITVLGGALGLFGAKAVIDGTHALNTIFPGFSVTMGTIGLGLAIAVVLGLVSGAIPAWRAGRLSVIEALRHVA